MSATQNSKRYKQASSSSHLGRVSTLSEVAACVKYALIEAPDALTGTFISPNGGQV